MVDIQSKRQKQKIESNAINFGDDGEFCFVLAQHLRHCERV